MWTLKLLAVTPCPRSSPTPTWLLHGCGETVAGGRIARAQHERKEETQGSLGAENVLSDNDVRDADVVIIAADEVVDRSRFAGKRVLVAGVAEGIHRPERLIERLQRAPVQEGGDGTGEASRGGSEWGAVYKAVMNGVSYMIPFVVVDGLLIAVTCPTIRAPVSVTN